MAKTFKPDLSDAISRVRALLGDTVTATALIEDETITYYLTQLTGETATAARLARNLSAQFAREVDFTVDGQGQKNGDRSKAFAALADRLDREAIEGSGIAPAGDAWSGGIIVTGATSQEVWDARSDLGRAANTPFQLP